MLIGSYLRFGVVCWSNLRGLFCLACLTLKDGTSKLSQNIGN